MKKKFYLLPSFFLLPAHLLLAGVLNPGFETTSGTVNCTGTNFSITRATSWNAIRISYTTGNCATPTFSDGTMSNADLFAPATSGCVAGPARSGNNAAHLEFRGFYQNQTASAEWLRQTTTSVYNSSRKYVITAYLFSQSTSLVVTPSSNYYQLGFRMVSTSVGSGASAIINSAKAQVAQPVTVTSAAAGWVKLTLVWTPPTTGTYHMVIGPWASDVFCNDGNFNILNRYNIDDVQIACFADAGPNKQNTCYFCCNPPSTSVQIGTPAIPGFTYLWSPVAALNNPTFAQPMASPCGTTTYTITAFSPECTSGTDAVVVTTLTNGACCRVSDNGQQPVFNVYPNPSKDGNITIDMPAAYRLLNITVLSGQNGTVIFSRQYKDLKQSEQLKLLLPPRGTQKEDRVLIITDPDTGQKFSVKLL